QRPHAAFQQFSPDVELSTGLRRAEPRTQPLALVGAEVLEVEVVSGEADTEHVAVGGELDGGHRLAPALQVAPAHAPRPGRGEGPLDVALVPHRFPRRVVRAAPGRPAGPPSAAPPRRRCNSSPAAHVPPGPSAPAGPHRPGASWRLASTRPVSSPESQS